MTLTKAILIETISDQVGYPSFGTGVSVKDGVIIIQGDQRDTLVVELKNEGFEVKISGG